MGEAWLARDERLGTEVVVKTLPGDATHEQVSLLRQECRNARRLAHPNIVRVFDFHQEGSYSFITMDYVDGDDIGSLRGASPQEVIRALAPLVDALEYAHEQGVVHRDLKIGNVLLDAGGRPHLTDFGISALLDPATDDLRLAGGGSRPNASPEQLRGEPPDPADDVYSLGVLLYELLVGRPPGPVGVGDDPVGSADPAPLRSRYPLPAGLQELVDAMLARARPERLADMTVVKRALGRILEDSVEPGTVPPMVENPKIRLSPPPKIPAFRAGEPSLSAAGGRKSSDDRNRLTWLASAMFVVLGGLGLAVFVVLPDWVENRRSVAGNAASGAEVDAIENSESATEVAQTATGDLLGVAEPVTNVPAPAAETSTTGRTPSSSPESQPVEPAKPAAATAPTRQRSAADEAYTGAMSEGLSAMGRGDHGQASQAFTRALAMRPSSVEAVEALAQAQEELRLNEISDHRARAKNAEQEERWHDAAAEYAAVLTIDPTLRFALEGQRRARSRADLTDRLDFHIRHAQRLASDPVLDEARELAAEAGSIESAGPKLRRQIELLEERIRVAATPIRVTLLSDNLTDVVVYRVGRLGRFERHDLNLRPGTYTVVGSRDGYRDVRRQLVVAAETIPEPLTVRCEEEI